jgi:broad specificity phosphatase PhoE
MESPRFTGTVHLVRHGEVENPKGIIYGRLPGYNLSERGARQAEAAARHLAAASLGSLWTSPLERAQETAKAIATRHELEVVVDDRIIESASKGEGNTLWAILRSPRHWWGLRNPWGPSWGESFNDIRKRMLSAIGDALAAAGDKEIALVSHQTPILVARLALARRSVPPWLGRVPCQTGSVTTIVVDDGKVVDGSYFVPSI